MYMLTPLHTHIDFGFGATGEAFKHAADKIEVSLTERAERTSVFNEHLPINYLRRHAVELFLKSAIVVFHRRFKIPYGDKPAMGEPYALVNGKWMPFIHLHSVKLLWAYVRALFIEHKTALDAIAAINWEFAKEVDAWIDTIDRLDPRSTFFRYPNPGESQTDVPKSSMARTSEEQILDQMTQNPEKKQFVVLMKNDEGEVMRAYYYAGPALAEFTHVLKEAADHFYGVHAALRMGVCKGA